MIKGTYKINMNQEIVIIITSKLAESALADS